MNATKEVRRGAHGGWLNLKDQTELQQRLEKKKKSGKLNNLGCFRLYKVLWCGAIYPAAVLCPTVATYARCVRSSMSYGVPSAYRTHIEARTHKKNTNTSEKMTSNQ